jgi:hypothetical protein
MPSGGLNTKGRVRHVIHARRSAGDPSGHPLVSVVIPAYNAEPFIDEAITSVLRQTYPHVEVIVVNDGSTDGTRARAAAYGNRIRVVERRSSGGFPGAVRNTGIAHCSGDFICFLDADDVMVADRLALQVSALVKHPKAAIAFIDYRNFSNACRSIETHFDTCRRLRLRLGENETVVLESDEATLLLLEENFGGAGLMLIRREVLDVLPGFAEQFRIGEDYWFYYQIARAFSVAIVNSVGVFRRLHGDNVTGNALARLEDYVLTRQALRATEKQAVNSRLLDQLIADGEISLAQACGNQGDLKGALSHTRKCLSSGSAADRLRRLYRISRLWVRNMAIYIGLKEPCS